MKVSETEKLETHPDQDKIRRLEWICLIKGWIRRLEIKLAPSRPLNGRLLGC